MLRWLDTTPWIKPSVPQKHKSRVYYVTMPGADNGNDGSRREKTLTSQVSPIAGDLFSGYGFVLGGDLLNVC